MKEGLIARARGLLPVALIVVVSALVFLPFAGKLGFYRDDWYMLWSANARGADSIIDLFSIDRPFMGYTYDLTYRLLGNSPVPWQVYAFVLKTLGALAVFGIVRLVWPEQRPAATGAALLFLIYPGFLGQPNAATKTNQLFSLTAGLASIWLSGLALSRKRKGARPALIAAAVLLGLVNFLLYEYMIGLEVMRVGVLWLLPQQTEPLGMRRRIRRFLTDAWPYALAILAFLVWRLGFFHSERGGTDQFSVLQSMLESARGTLVHLGLQSVMDVLETVVLAWAVPLERYAAQERARSLAAALMIGAAMVALCYVVMEFGRRWRQEDEVAGNGTRTVSVVLFAGLSLYGALFPVLIAGRDVNFDGGYDKYTLHASPAAAILLVGLIFGLTRGRGRQVLIGLLIFLGVSSSVLNAYHWERFWENQKTVWWQLWWRAPGLQDGTVLLVSIPEESFFEDYEMWGPANLIYRPGSQTITLGAEILNPATIAKVRAGTVETRGMRKLTFVRDFNRSLLLSLGSENSCLHVVDREDLTLPLEYEAELVSILRYSHVEQIDLAGSTSPPPAGMFGSEPEHDWCYFYQKAELAKQAGDWETVRALTEEVMAAGLKPIDQVEWLPFLEASLWAGDQNTADTLASRMSSKAALPREVCAALDQREFRFGDAIQAAMQETVCEP
jgi:hypothetical protein